VKRNIQNEIVENINKFESSQKYYDDKLMSVLPLEVRRLLEKDNVT
jgi:hypothetical protein